MIGCLKFPPFQILCVIPVPVLRWVLVGIAFGLSGYFLCANIYPILAAVCSVGSFFWVVFINTRFIRLKQRRLD